MIRAVILDLDNTIYDWVSFFVPSFEAMVNAVERESGITRAALTSQLQAVHQTHGTTEYAFVLSELDALHDVELLAANGELHPAIEAFRNEARERLKPYDGVREILTAFHDEGRTIVAYTDAMATYADARLEDLGLAPLFDALVATRDHVVPSAADALTYLPAARFRRQAVRSRWLLTNAERKPNPAPLAHLLDDLGVEPSSAIYVGDSLTRDIPLAQDAGVHDVHAAYGKNYEPGLWKRLVEVTHWTPSDVAREEELAAHRRRPTHEIWSFKDLKGLVHRLDCAALVR